MRERLAWYCRKEAFKQDELEHGPLPPLIRESKSVQLDMQWVLGETCSPPFDLFTPAVRLLLSRVYEDGPEQAMARLGRPARHWPNVRRSLQRALKNHWRDR